MLLLVSFVFNFDIINEKNKVNINIPNIKKIKGNIKNSKVDLSILK